MRVFDTVALYFAHVWVLFVCDALLFALFLFCFFSYFVVPFQTIIASSPRMRLLIFCSCQYVETFDCDAFFSIGVFGFACDAIIFLWLQLHVPHAAAATVVAKKHCKEHVFFLLLG